MTLAGLVVVAVGCKPGLADDCDLAMLEIVPVYIDAAKRIGETDPSDVAGLDAYLAKMRNALELTESAEEVCSGEALSEIRITKAQMLKEISKIEKTQAYNRGEIDGEEMLKEILKDE